MRLQRHRDCVGPDCVGSSRDDAHPLTGKHVKIEPGNTRRVLCIDCVGSYHISSAVSRDKGTHLQDLEPPPGSERPSDVAVWTDRSYLFQVKRCVGGPSPYA